MTASRKGVDSTETPPLSEAERAIKKAAKKARKEARRAEAAASELVTDTSMVEAAEEDGKKSSKKDKKRKAEEQEETAEVQSEDKKEKKKSKKDKKSKKEATTEEQDDSTVPATLTSTPLASTSGTPAPTIAAPSTDEITTFITENRVSYEPPETATELFPPVLSFAALPLDAGLKKGLSAYTKPTPIQSASFPVMMGGRDVVGIAETGYVSQPSPPLRR